MAKQNWLSELYLSAILFEAFAGPDRIGAEEIHFALWCSEVRCMVFRLSRWFPISPRNSTISIGLIAVVVTAADLVNCPDNILQIVGDLGDPLAIALEVVCPGSGCELFNSCLVCLADLLLASIELCCPVFV
jgi:hypothetical protein